MQLDYNIKEGIVGLLERILDSPYECDKWRTEAEKAYKFFGGDNPKLIAPTLRERMEARLKETGK